MQSTSQNQQSKGFQEINDQSSNQSLDPQNKLTQDKRMTLGLNVNKSKLQKIIQAKYSLRELCCSYENINLTGAISNNLKYIILGGEDRLLKIWKYKTINALKSIQFNDYISSCKFTEDSLLLYVGTFKTLHQFYANNYFKKQSYQDIHDDYITNIVCISNTIILTSSHDLTIIKTNVNLKQQLFQIQAHYSCIYGLDYNKNLNIFASGSQDLSIKLWDGKIGDLIIQKNNAHNNYGIILQVLFIINNNQLISSDLYHQFIIWNINYQIKELLQLQIICDFGVNISLILNQQFIITTGRLLINVYTIEGKFIRSINHKVETVASIFDLNQGQFNIIQLDSMKAVLILGLCNNYLQQNS